MKLTIHRGTHEIGGSCLEISSGSGHTRLIVDIGLPLINADGSPFDWDPYRGFSVDQLQDEKVLPNVEGLYEGGKPSVNAVLLSHAHLDHYGLLRFVHPDIAIYMSKGTRGLVEVANAFLDASIRLDSVHPFKMWRTFKVGEFTITPYLVDHSAPDAAAFLIEGEQRVFYTGDFRGHGRKRILLDTVIRNPPANVDYLVMEGSMLGRDEGLYLNEDAVEQAMYQLIQHQGGPCYVFTSSQNLDRLVSIYRATRRSNKTLVIDLYTAFVLDKLSILSPSVPQFSWQGVRVLFSHYHAGKLADQDLQLLYKYRKSKIDFEEIRDNQRDKVILVKDSQYSRTVISKLRQRAKATAVFSMWSGYLERTNLRHFLESQNIEMTEVHTSGHAYLSQLKSLAEALKPRFVIPIHTFHPERYSDIFPNVIQLKDGETMELQATNRHGSRRCRALSNEFIDKLNPEKDGIYGPLVELVRQNKDLHMEFSGQLDLQNLENRLPKDEVCTIHYKGNSILNLHRDGSFRIAPAFTKGVGLPKFLRTQDDVSTYVGLAPRIMFNVANYGKTSMEIEYEQMIIRANNLERRVNSEYIVVYNQYTIFNKQWDLLAIKWPRAERRKPTGQLALIEVKYALNPEIKTAYEQLERYYTCLQEILEDLCREMELILRQKLTLKLIERTPEQVKQLEKLKLERDPKKTEIILFLVDYNPNSVWKSGMIEKAKELPFAEQIRIVDGGLAMWDQGLKRLIQS